LSDDDYEREGWRPSWKPTPPPSVSTAKLSEFRDRDDLVDPFPPFVPGPVETATGEYMRQEGMRILSARVAELKARQGYQRLTSIEFRELMDSQAAIQTLEKMAPTGAVLPPRASALE
jgi:hypothetical protein